MLNVGGYDFKQEIFKSFYISIENSRRLKELRRKIYELNNFDLANNYSPHISLSYGDHEIKAKKELNHKLKRSGYVLASFGAFEVNGIKLKKGDALEITDTNELKITTQEESELLVIDV